MEVNLEDCTKSPELPSHQYLVETKEGVAVNTRYTRVSTLYRCDASPTTVELMYDSLTKTHIVLKRLNKARIFTNAQVESARREVEIHRSLHHINIVELLDHCETDSEFLMLMEFTPRHDYFTERIEVNNRPFNTKPDGDVEKLKSFSFDILRGLEYIHKCGVIHMDMKPGNLFLKPEVVHTEYPIVKIGDFGLSRRIDSSGGTYIEKECGTAKYIAPEVKNGAWVTTAVDIWCFGLIMHVLTVGFSPYVLKWTPGQEVPFNRRYWRKYLDTGLTDLISQCLKLEPSERITASQALDHFWFNCAVD